MGVLKAKAGFFLRLSLVLLIGIAFFAVQLYLVPSADAAYSGDAKEEWKFWQKKHNAEMAAKQKSKRKKKKWLNKKLKVKITTVKDIQVAPEIEGFADVVVKLKDVPGMNVNSDGIVVEKCLTCHDGVEQISAFHPVNKFGCTICHRGNGDSTLKAEAHKSLLYGQNSQGGHRNPSNFRVVDKSCGISGCHAGHKQDDQNHWPRVRKTQMSIQAGKISGIRYQWASQSEKLAKYAWVGVKDKDGFTPTHRGALKEISTIPVFGAKDIPRNPDGSFRDTDDMGNPIVVSKEISDSQMRKSCARCHFWIDRNESNNKSFANYRSQGCATCHAIYDNDGRYKGGDPTIPKDKSGHAKLHQLTTAVPAFQCVHCHNRGGRTGVTYQGNVEADFYGTPFMQGKHSDSKKYGKYYNTINPDIHYEQGLECIDCHTQFDVMGDGNIYSKKYEQVETRCKDCHGAFDEGIKTAKVTDPKDRVVRLGRVSPNYKNEVGDEMVLTARGNKYTNVKVIDGKAVLISKFDGREHEVPVITGKKGSHSIPQHQERLECASCHSRWTAQCYGCHDYYDQTKNRKDWMQYDTDRKKFNQTPGSWPEWRTMVRYLEPSLGINAKGKVSPYMPACQVQFNAINDKGGIVGPFDNFAFRPSAGYNSATVQSAMMPHSIRSEIRTCEDCHLNGKALGIGEGDLVIGRALDGSEDKVDYLYDMKKSGLISNFPYDAMVTPQGQQLGSNSHPGARPFNQKEINTILRVGTCLPCHDTYDDPIYQNIYDSYKKEEGSKHKKLVDDMLKASKTASIDKLKTVRVASKEVTK